VANTSEAGVLPTGWAIRPARDTDGAAMIALIWACWSTYPGIKMDVDGEMPELRTLATYYAGLGGTLWVADANGQVVGMIAVHPLDPPTWEICHVYVEPSLHGCGLGHALLDGAERHTIAAGAERLVLWSDTRFDRAHRFYEKRSYVRHGPIRVLNDISNSLEYGYGKPVDGVESLDIAAAGSAVPRLADITVACVDDGASVGFLAPLGRDTARAFWRQAATDVGAGRRVIVAAWCDGVLLGAGTLDFAIPENQRHRAEVQKIMVHPAGRRLGMGRRIMHALEDVAVKHGRSLLTLETRSSDLGEALCRAENWQEAGRIPDFARTADGAPHEAIVFWKKI
jgi:GNAT superfamily N-acetyltransferase